MCLQKTGSRSNPDARECDLTREQSEDMISSHEVRLIYEGLESYLITYSAILGIDPWALGVLDKC